MRHRIKKRKLGRKTAHRKALLRNLLRSLFLHGKITVSRGQAKEVKRQADILINQAKKNTVHSRRKLHEFFGKREIVNALIDKIAPVMQDRNSGFTTIQEVGVRRGDNAKLFKVELINKPENLGTFKPADK